MATYLQWSRKRLLKRMAWVCGPEQVLRYEVLGAYRDGMPAWTPGIHLVAGQVAEFKIWDEVLSVPAGGMRRVVIYNAEQLTSVGNFSVLAGAEGLESCFTVFVSDSDDFPRVVEDGKKTLAPHLALLQAAKDAQLIRCCMPGKEEDQVALVQSWWPGAGANIAHSVLSLSGGSLLYAKQACRKAVLAGYPATTETVRLVCTLVPGREFADYLLEGSKKNAIAVARDLTPEEVAAAIGLLASRLTTLAIIWDAKRRGWDKSDMAVRLHIDQFVLRLLYPHVGQYAPDRIHRCREALAVAESAWRSGAREGVPEALVALWLWPTQEVP